MLFCLHNRLNSKPTSALSNLLLILSVIFLNGHASTLLVPPHAAGERLPAVLVMHDHGAWFTIGKEKMACPEWRDDLDSLTNLRIQAEAHQWVNRCYSGMFVADSLMKEGFVVLVTDALYWGERGNFDMSICRDLDMLNLAQFNKTLQKAQPAFYEWCLEETGEAWFETILQEDKESVDYLCSLPFVDTTKIFTFGFSMGAYRSWQLAAEDPRIAGCAAANWMTTVSFTGGFITGPSSWSMYRPQEIDYPLIAAKISPRPFLLMYGTKDHVLPVKGTRKAIHMIRRQYKGRQFRTAAFPADHVLTPEHYKTLLRWLKSQTH